MSDKLIKLTDQNMKTHKGSHQWELGKKYEVEPDKRGTKLCTDQVFHAYRDINLALLMNPIHADIPASKLRIFEAEGQVVAEEWDKVGTHNLILTKELPLPEWYADVGVRKKVCVKFAAAAAAFATSASAAVFAAATAFATANADASDSKIDFIKLAKLAIKEALNDAN